MSEAFVPKILGDRRKLLPEGFAPTEGLMKMHSMMSLSTPINEPAL